MTSIGERIKEVRNGLGLSQQKFGERLKVTKAHISKIELSKDNPSDMLIKLICMEFNVNEEWLREGIGNEFTRFTVDNNAQKSLNSSLLHLNKELKANLNNEAYNLFGTVLNDSIKKLWKVVSISSPASKTNIIMALKCTIDLLSSEKPELELQKEYNEFIYEIIYYLYSFNNILNELFEKSSTIKPHPTVNQVKEAYYIHQSRIAEQLKNIFHAHTSASDIYKKTSFDEILSDRPAGDTGD